MISSEIPLQRRLFLLKRTSTITAKSYESNPLEGKYRHRLGSATFRNPVSGTSSNTALTLKSRVFSGLIRGVSRCGPSSQRFSASTIHTRPTASKCTYSRSPASQTRSLLSTSALASSTQKRKRVFSSFAHNLTTSGTLSTSRHHLLSLQIKSLPLRMPFFEFFRRHNSSSVYITSTPTSTRRSRRDGKSRETQVILTMTMLMTMKKTRMWMMTSLLEPLPSTRQRKASPPHSSRMSSPGRRCFAPSRA